jgi:heterodisulfide reductase subunit A
MVENIMKANESVQNLNSVLVIGAGIGGIKASIDLAESSFDVYLMDESPFIGGTLSQLDRQFPTNDCGMCKILPYFGSEFCSDLCLRMGLNHPNIDIITNAELKDLKGERGKFEAFVKKKARFVDPEKCIACNLCVDVCPIEVENDFTQKLSKRKAIYIRYPSAIPCVYAIDIENCNRCGECVKICPTKAVDLSKEDEEVKMNVGAVILALGFEPFDPIEIGALHYSDFQNVVTALEFERLLSGTGPNMDRILLRPSDDHIPKKIAFIQCVGSRDEERNYCSYACCMHSLKEAMMLKELYPEIDVTIFFMDMRVFGKGYHRYYEEAKSMGITFVRSRVADIEKEVNGNLRVNYVDETDEPKHETFDIVVLATGQRPPKKAKELGGILGIELDRFGFCKPTNGTAVETSKPGVFVCGSFSGPKDIPDTITEASAAAALAGSLLRKGGYEEEKFDKKEFVNEGEALKVDDVGEEENENIGIFICKCDSCLGNSLRIDEILKFAKSLPDVVLVEDVDFLCLELEDLQKKIAKSDVGKVIFGACAPYPFEIKFKKVLASAGINPSLLEIVNLREGCAWVHDDKQRATEKAKSLIAMANQKLRIQEPLQIGSKPVVPKALVIGGGISGMTTALNIAKNGYAVDVVENTSDLGGNARQLYYTMEGLDVQKLLKDMVEEVEKNDVITVYKNSEVLKVSGRAGDFLAEIKNSSDQEIIQYGAVVIATGANELVPHDYLYEEHEAVITQRELEKRLNEGKLDSKTLVMIQCIGLRDDEKHYCGRICCSQAIKNALKVKEVDPDAEVYVLYRDIMTYGFAEKYYIKAKEKGVNFIRYELEDKPKVNVKNEKLEVKVKDFVLDEDMLINPDLVILSLGPSPENNKILMEAFETELQLDEDGFFSEANVKFRPVDFLSDGIFVCGLAHSPRTLIESISQAMAVAGRALTILSKNEILARRLVSEVNERWCVGCEACIIACPYDARIMNNDKKVVKVEDALCQGCGVCAVVCPSGAAKLKGFKEKQMMAMIDEAVV